LAKEKPRYNGSAPNARERRMRTQIIGGRRLQPRGGASQRRMPAAFRGLLRPVNLTAIALLVWMSGPVAPFIPNLDSMLDFSLQAGGSFSVPMETDDALLRMSWIPAYLAVVVLASRHARLVGAVMLGNWPLLLLLGWALSSSLWSVSPPDTLRRAIALAASTVFGVFLGARFPVLWVVRLLAVALAFDIVATFICSLGFPAVGIASDADYAGAWRGVFLSKNSLGAMMLIGCLVFYILYFVDRQRRYLVALAVAMLLLVLSVSRTPLIILFTLVPALALTRWFARDRRPAGLILGMALCVGAMVVLFVTTLLEPLLSLLGRDATLTGRTDIWSLSWDAIQGRYWIGYGYGAFWINPLGPATAIWDALNWRAPSSHSGVLELWLGLGAIGVALFAALVWRTLLAILNRAKCGPFAETLWLVGYFLIFVVHAATEPSMMEQTSISWVLFIATVCAVEPVPRRRGAGPVPASPPRARQRPGAPDKAMTEEGGAAASGASQAAHRCS
jgi:exopolysaccharide production protein ExoQ